jgi:hypothetical protein
MKVLKILIILLLFLSLPVAIYADDNATSGSGETGSAVSGKGFYRGSEYMYKVSVYVGLSDLVNTGNSLSDYKMIGNSPVFVKPSTFTMPGNLIFGEHSKVCYLNGVSYTNATNPMVITDNPPPPPITNGGNINQVKAYFGDTRTLIGLIDAFAQQKGTTREGLVSDIQFTINGVRKTYPAGDILPEKVGDSYTNRVPWVVIYEPVIISYLKDGVTRLAFTATEYALAQKLGYFDFKFGNDGQYISGMTHSDLPNSVILEESWFGYPVTPALPDNVYWSEDRIIQGGGWGMRMLRANGENTSEAVTSYDYEYRVNTDVITSVRVHTNNRITNDNKAYVTFTVNGQSITREAVIPAGSSQLVWIKWRTPVMPQDINISVALSGNYSAYLDNGARSMTIHARVIDLNESIPPNPTFYDTKPTGFVMPALPYIVQQTSASWGVWNCWWKANWVWVSDWQWESDWEWEFDYEYDELTGSWIDNGGWVDHGSWVDYGEYVDKGDWQFDWTSYQASLYANMDVAPDDSNPTALEKTIKSGYGINLSVYAQLYSDAPDSDITGVQNVVSYYPEFNYSKYWRLLDKIHSGNEAVFSLKPNNYSLYNKRIHFVPLWYPDGMYIPQSVVIDTWTPAGMLSCTLQDYVNISGSLYDDYHIGPR